MLKAQRDSIRLLRAVLVASLVLPAALFGYSSWLAYHNNETTTDRQIDQTLDVLTEHALKVFESVERSLAEINEMIRESDDAQIAASQEQLYQRLKRIADSSEQVKSLWIFDRRGRTLVSSMAYPSVPIDVADRDYFAAHVQRDVGTFIGEILRPRPPYGGAPFFGVSRRRLSATGDFVGVVQASLLPDYFEGFYAKISRDFGSYAALIRDDGVILARLPALNRDVNIGLSTELARRMRELRAEGTMTAVSSVDGVERKVSYRRLSGLPVYVVSGLETRAIRAKWLAVVGSQMIFGIPATAALVAIVLLALRRTRRLYEEARLRVSAEDALKQAQRLESLGRLTGGVAHDFNNLLMVVGGAVRKLRRRVTDAQDSRALDMIDSAVAKGTGLTRQLLSFSRRNAMAAKVVDLADAVEKFADVLRQSVQSNVVIEIEKPEQPVAARIDPNEFEIALLNLTLNARDAMPDGGRITIAIGQQTRPPGRPGQLSGEVASLRFSDTGDGIAEEIRDRIFEPFFTTKPVDRGTGLGLSQIYGFVQQSHGEIVLTTELGRGSTFELLFPLSPDPPQRENSAKVAAAPVVDRPGTLLLVEDHADVSAVAADYAEQCGYAVARAESAEAALELLETRRDIRLVFSDIVMPGMSGLELGRLIRQRYPDLPVVLTSGYSDRSATALHEGFMLLQKPYTLEALRQSLAQAAGAPQTSSA